MKKRIFYIHPATASGKHPVSEKVVGKRKKVLTFLMAWIDPPGSWYEDEWNVHVDGCDYPFNSMEECKKRVADFYRYPDEEITFEETSEVFKFAWE